MDTNIIIEAKSLSAGYGRKLVLVDVNLTIRHSEYWVFLGPNGAGKSTLVQCIMGMINPLSGALNKASELNNRERIGFVPQRCAPNPTLPTTIREFVSLGTIGLCLPKIERINRIVEALDTVELAYPLSTNYWHLSGGERQRALIARALVRKPELLVLDEPTTELDIRVKRAFLSCVKKLNREQGLTIIFVTHDLDIAREFASHAALFYENSVLAGPSSEVLVKNKLDKMLGITG